ncbi:hypothetical protein JHK82_042072 [Glycine max]|uniref:Uncharacterized protein n=1 Tax=Glycine soja TaxID=3848 RepID=A0A0B2RPP9_GLYSO|nr:hypothetical protein GLYMA_15G119175v4 [Glycine max]KAG4946018.1 hypothetical protein JHK87_042025 [Glycine soja]KAG4948885.1 hypothetical protein JHK86_042124 [Glycine max]KAG4956364.1 hypothetical protein JHK85_042744 [Glycine max]KAG5105102.1 hypothetical protein JHK82_042072 [Glycine max]
MGSKGVALVALLQLSLNLLFFPRLALTPLPRLPLPQAVPIQSTPTVIATTTSLLCPCPCLTTMAKTTTTT